ncbi:hypothetical protein HDU87_001905 [Geranomyces variabilis]|uniref:Tail specific protease domain-containing protein n=1 Tax=Geranomyces variabilis TaxID=109894 RepID=A0AAD5TAU1_9FUNG|nr:hypothetical protein HDU87_001905 [Geranomyces variabilis]
MTVLDNTRDAPFASTQQRADALALIVSTIDRRFAVPEEGEVLVAELRKRIAAGTYDSLATIGEFADRLTTDMQDISSDKHMRVVFRSDTREVRPVEKTMEEERKIEENDNEEDETIESNKTFKAQSTFRNQFIEEVRILPGGIGYCKLLAFPMSTSAAQAYSGLFNMVADTRGLILDLTANRGGSSSADLLQSYLHKASRRPVVALYHRFTDTKNVVTLHPCLSGPRYDDRPVWVLISNDTFSAAEHFACTAKALGRVRLIGEKTGGGGRGCEMYWIHPNLDLSCSTYQAVCVVDGSSWEGCGVKPHIECPVEDALSVAHLEALELIVPVLEADPVLKHFGNGRGAKSFGRQTLDELRERFEKKMAPADDQTTTTSTADVETDPQSASINPPSESAAQVAPERSSPASACQR